jgi:peptidoglycan/LPS O-acetylase OafA/YrhL
MHSIGYLKLDQIPKIIVEFLSLFPGVPIFFVMSGFLISASYERDNNIWKYTKNRVLRIYPALWVSLVIAIITMYIFFENSVSFATSIKWFFARATFLQFYHNNIFNDYGMGNLNGTLWTIFIELQFYVLVPILYGLFKNNLSKTLVILFFISFSVNLVFKNLDSTSFIVKLVFITIWPYLYMFLFGVFIQKNYWIIQKLLKGKFVYLITLYLVFGYICIIYSLIPKDYYYSILVFLLVPLIFSLAYSKVNFNLITLKNDISYGIYIYHLVIINIFIEINLVGDIKYLFLLIILTIFISTLSWKFIEKPSLKLKDTVLLKRVSR